jgi:hypothetical protein
MQSGRTFIPVLIEQDFYRAEIEQIEVFAPLVPVDRVWIENIGPPPVSGQSVLDAPPVRYAIPATEVAHLTGERIVQRVADGFVRDLRAISEKYLNSAASPSVRLCTESDWYAWAINGRVPAWSEVPVEILWLE